MKKISNLSLPAVILIASIILGGFYFTAEVFKQKSEDKIREEAENKKALTLCLENAENWFNSAWEMMCSSRGLEKNCILSLSTEKNKYIIDGNMLHEELDTRRNKCFEEHDI